MSLGSIAAAIVVLVSGCASTQPGEQPDSRNDRWLGAVQGLCDSVSRADSDDVPGARAAFLDRSHGPLHEIAAEVQGVDRFLAADLLEAKNRVEADFESGAGSGALPRDIRSLFEATIDALEGLEVEAPRCEDPGG